MSRRQLTLASASESRLRLLRAAGIEPNVLVSGVDEDAVAGDLGPDVEPAQLAMALAEAKAVDVATTLGSDALVVGCDSVFVVDGEVLGKPGSPERARDRWLQMRGLSGELITGHCVIDAAIGQSLTQYATTTVSFADVSAEEIDWYVDSGEPIEVAGAFTLDGKAAPFILRIEGDPSNVIGLSLPLVRGLLASLDIPWTSIVRA